MNSFPLFVLRKIGSYWFKRPLWQQILVGLFFGIATGLIFKTKAVVLEPFGFLFIHAIQLLVAPVVLTSIVCAILSLENYQSLGKILSKALFLYAFSMAIAASLAIFIANFLKIGKGLTLPHTSTDLLGLPNTLSLKSVSFSHLLLGMVPNSAFQALASNNVLQILIFAVILGIALKNTGEEARPVRDLFLAFSKVVFKFCQIIISFAPYGIFALIASVFGAYGLSVLLPLFKFIASVYLSCFLLMSLYYSVGLLLKGISPRFFFASVISPMITAYTTSSSAATLPITLKAARENLKLNPNISDFLLPLGTSLNLNGLSIYLATAAIFSAHIFGISFGFSEYLTLILSIVLMAAGAAAIPGSAIIVMGAILQSAGIPLGALPLIAGVDRFNDMAQTATNVTGDLFAATVLNTDKKAKKKPSEK